MLYTTEWKDYELIDCSGGEKLERWGDIILIRPDPQVIWHTPKNNKLWYKANARYVRSKSGGGHWEEYNMPKKEWDIHYRDLTFRVKPTGFKHTGLFPEQGYNWDFLSQLIKNRKRQLSVLNLFAYTGGATLACAAAGAKICHVDASKGMVNWARENAALSGLSDKPIRWIVDDCRKFAEREIRRGRTYDIILMDPPSYGRGPGGEIWKLEDEIYRLVELCSKLLSPQPVAFLINSYTTGLSASVMQYILGTTVAAKHTGILRSSEIGLPVTDSGYTLPCGSTAVFMREDLF